MNQIWNLNSMENARILLDGMFYSELPELIDREILKNNIQKVLDKIRNYDYEYYKYDADSEGFITDFKSITSPKYIRGAGTEAITFYGFKNDGSFREMQIPNLILYCAFIYDSLYMFDEVFENFYLKEENDKYVSHSNSYVVVGEKFIISTGYDLDEMIQEGVFVTNNNKVQGRIMFGENRKRYNEHQDTYLYSAKVDIESFFPNLYTHNFEKMANYPPCSFITQDKRYFSFLDRFHQKINNNQTKGIPAGQFSSHIAAELLMLCVDYDIGEIIKDRDMEYVRYVDDMVFFADTKSQLEDVVACVQKILVKYRLRINGNKTEYCSNVSHLEKGSNRVELFLRIPFLRVAVDNDSKDNDNNNGFNPFDIDNFDNPAGSDQKVLLEGKEQYNFKKYIAELLQENNISQIRTILTLFLKALEDDRLDLSQDCNSWFCYFLTLAFEDVRLVSHVYRILDAILEQEEKETQIYYIQKLKDKTPLIERKYTDTIFQIWHYYVMIKYMNPKEKQELLKTYCNGHDMNPLILCLFVEEGTQKNTKLFSTILKKFQEELTKFQEESPDGSASDGSGSDRSSPEGNWKEQIMFSRWWLPILKIRMMDSYNYYGFLQAASFPKVLADLMLNDG